MFRSTNRGKLEAVKQEMARVNVLILGISELKWTSVQFSRSVMFDSLRPHELQNASLPVHHQLLELTQTQVHRVGDAIQPSHPLSSPSPPALNFSQHKMDCNW